MCPGIAAGGNLSKGTCPNLTETGPNQWCWSSYPYNSKVSLHVKLYDGGVGSGNTRELQQPALCK